MDITRTCWCFINLPIFCFGNSDHEISAFCSEKFRSKNVIVHSSQFSLSLSISSILLLTPSCFSHSSFLVYRNTYRVCPSCSCHFLSLRLSNACFHFYLISLCLNIAKIPPIIWPFSLFLTYTTNNNWTNKVPCLK